MILHKNTYQIPFGYTFENKSKNTFVVKKSKTHRQMMRLGGGARKNSGALQNLNMSRGGSHGNPVSGNHQAHIKLNKSSVEVKENTNQQSDGMHLLQGRVGQGANHINLSAERQQK